MTSPVSLLDVVTPEPGYRFVSGVWCTHDLTVSAMTDWLLPALVGIESRERTALAGAPAHLASGALLVLAAADRITTTGLLPDAVTVLPVHGRRLHAKAAVLRYEKIGGPANRWYTLTIVTSANLTHGGLTRNRELVGVVRATASRFDLAIAAPVLSAIRELRDDIPSHRRSHLTGRLGALKRGWPAVVGGGPVLHSLGAPPAMPFTAGLVNGPADRLLLVGPAFAADDSDVAAVIAPLLGPSTRVEVVVDGGAPRDDLSKGLAKVRVPAGLLSGLKGRCASVTVHATPIDDDPSGPARRLHGKAVLAQHGGAVQKLVGSVNITKTGLTGRNRELAVVTAVSDTYAIDAELSQVRAVTVPARCLTRVGRDESLSPTVSPSAAPILAIFTPDQGQHFGLGVISGIITVDGVGPQTVIDVDGALVRLHKGCARVQLDPVRGLLSIASGPSSGRTVLVTVSAAEGDAFWEVPSDMGHRRDDPLLALLRADVERAAKRAQQAGSSVRVGGHDAFGLPGNVRLNALVRHRNVLARYDRDRQDAIIDQLFPDDPAETEVAMAIVQSSRGDRVDAIDPVIDMLVKALDSGPGVPL